MVDHPVPADSPVLDPALATLLEGVKDPEIPVLSVLDLGIVRAANIDGSRIEVVITPTYSGCPAMNTIEADIRSALAHAGYESVNVRTVLSPAWTTDWLTPDARERLHEYGIAPPVDATSDKRSLLGGPPTAIACPRCGSESTERLNEFGSTACKALYRCRSCLEPFDYFKCI